MTRGMASAATRPILGLANRPQLQSLRGLVGQGMTPKPAAGPLIADFAPGLAIHGYSFRKIRSAYVGPSCRLLRVSDSAERDFGFTSQDYIDIPAINAWLDGSSAKIVRWYDQIGSINWRDEGASRPDLVISGSRAWANTINAGGFLGGPSLSSWAALVVGRPYGTGQFRTLFWTAPSNSAVMLNQFNTNLGKFDGSFVQFGTQTWGNGENASVYLNFLSNPVTGSKNNNAAGSAGSHNATREPNGLGINPDTGGVQPFGRIDEVLFFSADLPVGLQTVLNANQASFYGI